MKLDKNIINIIYNEFQVLRDKLAGENAENLYREVLTLKLLINEKNKGDYYFQNKIEGDFDLDYIGNNYFRFYEELDKLVSKNRFLDGLFIEINKLKENGSFTVIDVIIEILNNTDGIECVANSAEVFKYYIDSLFRSAKSDIVATPYNINKLISEIVSKREIKNIYDPAIGTGLLISAVASMHEKVRIYGQDINSGMIKICKMLMILEKRIEDLDNIWTGNSIIDPKNISYEKITKFDCVVCNPPFSMKDWGYNEIVNDDKYNRFFRGLPSRLHGDYAFITQAIESLNENGIAIMIEPSGVLFRAGAEGVIRKKLIEENLIDCIIALPNNMMYSTAIPVNIIIFNKNKKHNDILFVNLSNKIKSHKVLTTLKDEEISEVCKIYNNRLEIEGLSKKVNFEEIKFNEFNLNITKYVEEYIEKEELNLLELRENLTKLKIELYETQKEIDKFFNN